MPYRKKALIAGIAACFATSTGAYAQDAAPATTPAAANDTSADQAKQLQGVTVTGIRASLKKSLERKRDSAVVSEVVTAEDVGKLPAKNVADTLQRLPGVNISSASADEGGFDENDRVSLRGTNPSLTQTLVNGHTIGTGDWFVLSQVQTVGRSVSYSLLPSEIVSQVVVQKSSEASLVEGGTAGSVNIVTRRPLDFGKPLTAEVSAGGVYADLPSKTDPQFSGLVNWKPSRSFGVMLEGFYEKRDLQRNGQEVVGGYNQIAASDTIAKNHPDLAGVYYPNLVGETLFTQKREREGGLIDVEWKPTNDLTLDLNGFYSKLNADNYNRNYMLWNSQYVPSGAGLQPGYTVQNNVLTGATFSPQSSSTVTPYGVYDQISRPGASSESNYVTLDGKWHAAERWTFGGQVGTTHGKGNSPTQDVIELGTGGNAGGSWQMRGPNQAINWVLGGDNSTPSGILPQNGWIFGGQDIHVKDSENWFQGDGTYDIGQGMLSTLQFGARYATHKRENPFEIAQGPNFATDWQNPANYPTTYQNYPSDFSSSLGGSFPGNVWYYSPGQLAAIDAKFANRDPVTRFYFQDTYSVKENDAAGYAQLNFSGDRWSGNIGARYVNTDETIGYASTNPDPDAKSVTGPITGSAFGDYYWNVFKKSYGTFLPSGNLKFDLTQNLVARAAASQTMTRPDYSALAGSVSANDLTHQGSGGNPKLNPIVSTNFDGELEWYFAPRGLLSAGVYSMDLQDYVNFGNQIRVFKDIQASQTVGHDVFSNYTISVPTNTHASIHGVEFNYIQPILKNFGFAANYTWADGKADGGQPMQGTSKNTYNLSGYFESDRFNARVSYTYRSEFFAGVTRAANYYQQGTGNLAAALGAKITDWASVSFDALNLNNPTLRYTVKDPAFGEQPHASYVNGRQYYFNLHLKF
ncbi:TonB-dependent receptor [Nevskia soli]|uniref:TonB-dependent receptor n=1 Tax=Nevskia soli TaxID=418856 RepID=UPI0004A78154|nr:TonB-dependent receptor [Nevskia soli]